MATDTADVKSKQVPPRKTQAGWHPTTKRRWSIILLAVFGAAIVITLRLLIPAPFESAIAALAALTTPGRTIAYFVIGALLGHFVWSLSGFHRPLWPIPWQSFLKYPPTWSAGLIGALIFVGAEYLVPFHKDGMYSFSMAGWGCCGPVFFLGFVIEPIIRRWFSGHHQIDGVSAIQERPISSPDEDEFDSKSVAERIKRLITEPIPKSIVLDGPFGSGKSSVINLVEYLLQEAELNSKDKLDSARVLTKLVKIRGWGLSEDNVANYVLEALVRAVAEHVDATAIARLPAQYSAIMSKGHSLGEMVASAVSATHSAEELIQRADDMLEAAGIRIILAVEDIDRNPNTPETWASLGALLDRIRVSKNIAHILAIDGVIANAESGPDSNFITRVSDLRIPMPVLPTEVVMKTIREWWAENEKRNGDIILPRSDARERMLYSTGADMANKVLGGGTMRALAECLSTPRLLKLTIRDCAAAWDSLHGEVDIHDLFFLKAIYNTNGEVFQFIRRHIYDLQIAEPKSDDSVAARASNRINKAWRKVASEPYGERYKLLVHMLFPNWRYKNLATGDQAGASDEAGDSFMEQVDFAQAGSRQGIAVEHPEDYANRYFREALQPNIPKDQTVLKDLNSYMESIELNSGGRETFIGKILVSDIFALKVEQFFDTNNKLAIRCLADDYVAVLANDDWKRFPSDERFRFLGFWSVARILRNYMISDDEYKGFLIPLLRMTARSNLTLFSDILYGWTFSGQRENAHRRLGSEFYVEALQILQQSIEDDRDRFLALLADTRPYWFHWIIILYSSREHLSRGYGAHDWEWWADFMLWAAKQDPKHVLPQLAMLASNRRDRMVADEDGAHAIVTYGLEDGVIDHIFKDRRAELMTLLAQDIDMSHLDDAERARVLEVRNMARRELKNGREEPGEES